MKTTKHIKKQAKELAKTDLKKHLAWYWTYCNHAHANENTAEAKKEFMETRTNFYSNELTRIKKALLNGRFYVGVVSVSRSGMSRKIKLAYVYRNELRKIKDPQILKLAGVNSKGNISGCGMDMLFHAQYTLFHNLHTSYKKAHYQRRMPQYKELI